MKKKTLKKWSNRLMKSAIIDGKERNIKYISSKHLGRMLVSEEFKKFFQKYKGFKFEDIKEYLSFDIYETMPIFDKSRCDYIVRTESDIFTYTLIIDNPSREFVHLIKNRKFYLGLYYYRKVAMINIL